MSQCGHCCYYAQREELYWCILKKAAIMEEDYHKHCSFGAEARCPLCKDMAFSELTRRRHAARRLLQEGKSSANG